MIQIVKEYEINLSEKADIMLRQNKRVIECLLISEKSNGANC